MPYLAELFQSAQNSQEYTKGYIARLTTLLQQLDHDKIARIIHVFENARDEARTIFFLANGGSAAVASHWVNDLVAGAWRKGQKNFRAFCLTDNQASVTAIANDVGYEHIFTVQLEGALQPHDVVCAFSVSGRSRNVVEGLRFARERGAHTIGVCGFDDSVMREYCDVLLHIPATSDEYGPVEDIFGILDHLVSGYLTMKSGKWLYH
jgi:D-sedoheptulose 7-phosphate isomerase